MKPRKQLISPAYAASSKLWQTCQNTSPFFNYSNYFNLRSSLRQITPVNGQLIPLVYDIHAILRQS